MVTLIQLIRCFDGIYYLITKKKMCNELGSGRFVV
jgi:hypothetical protein